MDIRTNIKKIALALRLVQVPILGFRVRPAASGQGITDLHRVPADAAGR
jgi:hypothetical protein